jgi:hypothetical protein
VAGWRDGVTGSLAGIVISSDDRKEVAHTSLAVLPDDSATRATGIVFALTDRRFPWPTPKQRDIHLSSRPAAGGWMPVSATVELR